MTMASSTGHVMNLSNSIIGVSLLAMPFCFKQCGITLAILMLILSSTISRLACHFLVKSSIMCRRRNFEFLAFYTFGPSGKLLVELGVIGFLMGTCVAFFVVMGDLGPAIVSKIFNVNNNNTLRTSVLIGLGLLVVLPLGLLRNVESLAAISTVTIGYYFLFIVKIFFESSSHLVSGDWWTYVRFWQPEGILQCIPIFAMALSCQTQLFEIYNSLPSPSIEKMNAVVGSALNLCTVVYTSVGLLGYIAYCKGNFTGNIMLSFTPSLSSEMFKLGFVMSIALSFPLVIFPCRASLFSLMFKRMPIHQELSHMTSHIPDSRFKCLTVAIVSVALVTGLLIPSIELVLGFVGSTIGVAICVIFPSLSFLNLYNKNTQERAIAKMVFFLGFLIMIMGTLGNLFAAVENKSAQLPPGEVGHPRNFPQVKTPFKTQLSTEMPNKHKGVGLMNSVSPDKLSHKPPEALKSRNEKSDNIRKEPPVPIAPLTSNKDKQQEKAKIEVIDSKITGGAKKQSEPQQKNSKDLSEVKSNENINKDAIEKEEREIMEVEKQKKAEEDRNEVELLQRLKENQDEQKKLLQEQEKILKEMKNRESDKKLKEEAKAFNFLPEEPKPVKSGEFRGYSYEIQNVVNNLKETKIVLEKDKLGKEKMFETKLSNMSKGNSKAVETQESRAEEVSKVAKESLMGGEAKGSVDSIPLPLAKLRSPPEMKNEEEEEKKKKKNMMKMKAKAKTVPNSKQKALGRDILVETSGREKRDADEGGGECENDERKEELNFNSKETKKTDTNLMAKEGGFPEERSNRSSVLLKNSAHLNLNLSGEKKPQATGVEAPKFVLEFQNQPFISKKRDLKSYSTVNR